MKLQFWCNGVRVNLPPLLLLRRLLFLKFGTNRHFISGEASRFIVLVLELLESGTDNGIFSGGMTCLFFCTASATANLFGFFLTLVGAGCYGYAVFKHRKAVS